MSRFNYTICLLLFILPLYGQNSTDELIKQLNKQKNDAEKVRILIKLAENKDQTNSEQALQYAEQALQISEHIQDKTLIAQAQLAMSSANFDAWNYQKSIEYAKSCEPFFENSDDYQRLAALYNLLSAAHFYIGNSEMNDFYAEKCIQVAEKHQILHILSKQYYNRGAILFYRGDLIRSMEYAFKALNIIKKDSSSAYMESYCYDLIGTLSQKMEDYSSAIKYYRHSRDIYMAKGDNASVGQNYFNTGNIYLDTNKFDSARIFYTKALEYSGEAGAYEGIANAYMGIAMCYKRLAELDSAQFFIEKSLKAGLLSESKKDMAPKYLEAGDIYFLQGDIDQSFNYLYKSLNLVRQNNFIEKKTDVLYSLSRNYAELHNYDSAFHYLNLFVAIKDSLNQVDNIKQRAYMFAEHNVKEEVEKERAAEQQKRRLWLVILVLSLIVIVILCILIRISTIRQRKIKTINAELNKYKSDLENIVQDKTRELVMSEQQIINLSNNMPNGAIFRFAFENEREGKTLFVSSGWEELTGQSVEAAKDSVLFFQNKIHPDDSRELLSKLASAIRNHSVLDVTYRFYKNNTDMRWFHVRAVAVAGDDGMTYLDGYQVDETDQKGFERDLVIAKEKAEESDRLKSAFLANMSHEIRTPMNAIIGFSSLLSNMQLPPKRQAAYLELIQENCQYLLRLIDDIVDISKIEAEQLTLRMKNYPVSEIMSGIKDYFEPIMQNKPYVEFLIDENSEDASLMIYTDIFRLKQIFINLIDNALKFTEKGIVRCGHLLDRTDAIHFFVMDTGIGIAQENIDNIFQSFRKIDQNSNGTGLGLSIVKKMLLQMGGTIWVESEAGAGSTFHFTLPLAQQK